MLPAHLLLAVEPPFPRDLASEQAPVECAQPYGHNAPGGKWRGDDLTQRSAHLVRGNATYETEPKRLQRTLTIGVDHRPDAKTG